MWTTSSRGEAEVDRLRVLRRGGVTDLEIDADTDRDKDRDNVRPLRELFGLSVRGGVRETDRLLVVPRVRDGERERE